MMDADIESGDVIKKSGQRRVVDEADSSTVKFADGTQSGREHIARSIQSGKVEYIPSGGERDTYIRFGEIPDGEQSYDSSAEQYEDGVSVYGEACVDGVHVPTEGQILGALLLLQRDSYLVSGRRVGTGADGEPLIRDVEIEQELTLPEDERGFVPVADDE